MYIHRYIHTYIWVGYFYARRTNGSDEISGGNQIGLLLSKCVGYYPISDDYFKACVVFRFFINSFIHDLYIVKPLYSGHE